MRPLHILFDATLLSHGLYRSSARTGIFFAAWNLFEQFRMSGRYSLVLYCQSRYLAELKLFLADAGLGDLPVFSPQDGWERFRTRAIDRKERARRAGRRIAFVWHRCVLQIAKLGCRLFPHHADVGEWREVLAGTDVYFSPVYKIPDPVLSDERIRCGVMLYDVIAIRHPELKPERCRGRNWWLQELLDQIDMHDRLMVFPISEETRREASALCPHHPRSAWRVAWLAADCQRFAPCTDAARRRVVCARHGIADAPFFLVVGTVEPRKNLLFAVRAFASFVAAHPDSAMLLVVAGGSWNRFARMWRRELASLGPIGNRIVQTGYVADEDLPVLYSSARAFVFPSLYEGFGLPLLEAMSCGCPVLASNASAMPEVVADAGVLFDPHDIRGCAAGMEQLAFDDEIRARCASRGLARAAQFSWKRCFSEIERGLSGDASGAVA